MRSPFPFSPRRSVLLPLILGSSLVLTTRVAAQIVVHEFVATPGASRDLGFAVLGVGDLDGDGTGDLLMSDPAIGPGIVRACSGRTGSVIYEVSGLLEADWFGAGLALVGDVDGDGVVEFVVGAPRSMLASQGPGYVRVHRGRDGAVLSSMSSGVARDDFGWQVAGLGDVDGDGDPDIAVGSRSRGKVAVHSARDGRLIREFLSPNGSTSFGTSVAGLGDVDGDGFADLAIGEPAGRGAVHAVSVRRATTLWSVTGRDGAAFFGRAIAAVGDLDGDGVGEVLIGAHNTSIAGVRTGEAVVCSGRDGTEFRVHRSGTGMLDQFGSSVARCGDLDGDGADDYAVGAPARQLTTGRASAGVVTVYSGRGGAILFEVEGRRSQEGLGYFAGSLAAAGDVDGDGREDLALGSPNYDSFADRGRVRVVSISGPSTPADFRVRAGSGCHPLPTNTPRIDAAGVPRLGREISFRVGLAPRSQIAVLNLGTPVAVDLTFAGLPGCTLDAAPDVFALPVRTTADGGFADVPGIRVPNDQGLLGVTLVAQWLCMDPGRTAVGIVLSESLDVRIGG